jgi:hypothetical protein
MAVVAVAMPPLRGGVLGFAPPNGELRVGVGIESLGDEVFASGSVGSHGAFVSPSTAASSRASSWIVWKRSSGLTAAARSNHASKPSGTGASFEGIGVGSEQIVSTSSPIASAVKGRFPVRHSKAITAIAHRSARGVDLLLSAQLLRAHVVGRAEHGAGRGRDPLGALAVGQLRLVEDLRDAEVDDLRDLGALCESVREEDVVGLQVAVDDACAVGLGDRAEHAREDRRGRRGAEAPLAPQAAPQRLAVEELHRDVGHVAVDPVVEGCGRCARS